MIKRISSKLVLLLLLATVFCAAAQNTSEIESIGTIALFKGTATARGLDGSLRDLDIGSKIYLGETISTSRRSFVVINFRDESRVTLQPHTELYPLEYEEELGQESMVLELLKGGLRAVTGKIGKREPKKVTYRARNTVVGIRGTTFAMRLCALGQPECEFRRAVTESGSVASNERPDRKLRIVLRSPIGGQPTEISREEYARRMGDTFVGLIEGQIVVTTTNYVFELDYPRPCRPGEKPSQHGGSTGPCEPIASTSMKGAPPPSGGEPPPLEDQHRRKPKTKHKPHKTKR